MMRPLIAAVLFFGCITLSASEPKPGFQRVFIIVFENSSAHGALAQPFFSKLSRQGAYFTDFRAEGHPSYPNYLALVSGSTWRIHTDAQANLDVAHIGDLLEAKHKTWRVYAQGFPGNCFLDAFEGKYARRHVPFLSFKNVQNDRSRCARVVEAGQLTQDIEKGQLADFSLYIPDNDNNGHDTGVTYADRWFSQTFGPLLNDNRFTENTLFVVTFDEDDYRTLHNNIFTLFWGAGVLPGQVSGRYNHYSILRTIEEAWDLGSLGVGDARARPITGIWGAWHASSNARIE